MCIYTMSTHLSAYNMTQYDKVVHMYARTVRIDFLPSVSTKTGCMEKEREREHTLKILSCDDTTETTKSYKLQRCPLLEDKMCYLH